MVMVALQKRFHVVCHLRQLFNAVLGPAEALASDRAVEAFDERLFVLFVRTGNPVLTAEVRSALDKLGLELAAAISLDGLHKAVEPARHRKPQECFAVHCQQECFAVHCQKAWPQQDVGFTTEDVHSGN